MLLLALSCLTSMLLSDGAVVVTTTGPVRGKLNRDHNVEYYSYEGIPYAESPTGALRFKAPVPKHAWTEVLDATKAGPVCPQPVGQYNKTQMSEDCLILNIHVPITGSGELLPVFVFVHGGAYKTLSGNTDVLYGPQLYLKRELIYLSVNYRLGALGYLSLENEDYPGNAGLKDVLLSLKWIKANIERFGGDNKKLNWAKLNYNVTEVAGTAHSDDLGYQFVTERTKNLLNDIDSRTRRMVDVMITLFTNFIKHGNPTPNGYEGTKWPLYDREGKYLVLSESPSVGGRRPQARRLDFWYHVYQEFEEYINSGGQMADYN
ncbi:juvenile hormone esterase-like isoform X2 [Plodia interpunctella]|uniref:juvenile hormone esterase-like isoform X2 n=1 Tax=Plodia interpunctella TaxID=58824 RepID=UPI0023674EE9|nr:juvenile hormone esterase-like isoform X2 [Plodia interpunctella]